MESSFKFNFGETNEIPIPIVKENCDIADYNVENCNNLKEREKDVANLPPTPNFKEHLLTIDNVHGLHDLKEKGNFLNYELKTANEESETVRQQGLQYLSNQSFSHATQLKERGKISHSLIEMMKYSDLNSGVYEGGFKVWECSFDLVEFLQQNKVELTGKNVLEVGCGAALPGIFCLLSGSSFVCLQDFNAEVIDMFTIPNIICNNFDQNKVGLHDDDDDVDSNHSILKVLGALQSRCLFLSGNWESTDCYLQKRNIKFDVILSSETIYNPDSYSELHALVCNSLNQGGIAVFANKSYYFGVGGGTRDFMDFVIEKGKLTAHIAQEFTEGLKREIIKLQWK